MNIEPQLRVGGLVPCSTTDCPDSLAAVVFCQGCPWRCGYCHNPHLLPSRGTATLLAWCDVLAFLERRQGLLDAVVFSGGEPLAQRALGTAVDEVRAMGFRIGLHTGGAYPERLESILPRVDWVGFDVKAPFNDYAAVTGVARSGERARRSARLLLQSGVAHEFRTTVHPALLPPDALARLAGELSALGVRHYVVQEFRAEGCRDDALCAALPDVGLPRTVSDILAPRFERVTLRRGTQVFSS